MEELNATNTEQTAQTAQTAKTYTQAEVDELLQQEGDRRVSQALKKREKEMSESAKLSAMNESEKARYTLEQREKELLERERTIQLNENKYEASKILSEKGLPVAFADFVVTENAESTRANIKVLEKVFSNAVAEKVKAQIGYSPIGSTSNTQVMSKDQLFKLSISEQSRLMASNPDLYNQLTHK